MAGLYDRLGRRKYLNESERIAFHQAALRQEDPQTCVLLLTLLHTGVRLSEALQLTWERVDLNEQCLVFRTLKQRERTRYRAIPIPPELVERLQTLPRTNQRIWPIGRTKAWQLVKACMNNAGLSDLPAGTPKGLRHGFAVACLSQGLELTLIQTLLGHASLQTTSIYLQLNIFDQRNKLERVWSLTNKSKK